MNWAGAAWVSSKPCVQEKLGHAWRIRAWERGLLGLALHEVGFQAVGPLGHACLGWPGFHGPSAVSSLQKNGLKVGHDLGQKKGLMGLGLRPIRNKNKIH